MTKPKKVCGFCKEALNESHGNRRYHPDCTYALKKQRSINQYAKQNLQLDPLWSNEKILRELYHSFGEQYELTPDFLKKKALTLKSAKANYKLKGLLNFSCINMVFLSHKTKRSFYGSNKCSVRF